MEIGDPERTFTVEPVEDPVEAAKDRADYATLSRLG